VPKVFLSHNHADKPFVRRLATDLVQAGADIWIDEVEMKVGDSLIGKISSGITESDFVAVVLSQHSVTSPWVTQELEIALTMQIGGAPLKVLPLRLDRAPLPPFLVGKLYSDFSDAGGYREGLRSVARAVGIPFVAGDGPDTADVRWHCGYCGWACRQDFNDYRCLACGAVRLTPIGSSTMISCPACGGWSLAIAAYCDGCGHFLGRRRFGQ